MERDIAPQADALLNPARLWTRAEVVVRARDCPVPRQAGVYAWYFREVPPGVPPTDCRQALGATLLYVGISPKKPPSGQDLRGRIRYHYCGNAEGSTLRLTLGCLLGIPLRRVGSGRRRTFADGEERLSEWMAQNALVIWLPTTEPWLLEEQLIATVSLPLNLDQNRQHAFHARLSALRSDARARANASPIWRATPLPGLQA